MGPMCSSRGCNFSCGLRSTCMALVWALITMFDCETSPKQFVLLQRKGKNFRLQLRGGAETHTLQQSHVFKAVAWQQAQVAGPSLREAVDGVETQVFVDPIRGDDDKGDGSTGKPVSSLFQAFALSLQCQTATICLRAGAYKGKRNRRLRVTLARHQRVMLVFAPNSGDVVMDIDTNEGAERAPVLDGDGRYILNITGDKGSELSLHGLVFARAGTAIHLSGFATVWARACAWAACDRGAIRAEGAAKVGLVACGFFGNIFREIRKVYEGKIGDQRMQYADLYHWMGGALALGEKTRARVLRSRFEGNGGKECVAGGAVVVATDHVLPKPAHVIMEGCLFFRESSGDSGGAVAVMAMGCVNVTNCDFRNCSAWGVTRGGGGIYVESRGKHQSWVYGSNFSWCRCASNGGALMRVDDLKPTPRWWVEHMEESESGEEDENRPQPYVRNKDLHCNLDVRDCGFRECWPAWASSGPRVLAIDSRPSHPIDLGVRAASLPSAIENQEMGYSDEINTTVPWEMVSVMRDMQDDLEYDQRLFFGSDYSRSDSEPHDPPITHVTGEGDVEAQMPGEGDVREKYYRIRKHWDEEAADPDTGFWNGDPNPLGLKPLEELENQTAVREYQRLEEKYGPGGNKTLEFIAEHVGRTFEECWDEEYRPEGGWSETSINTSEEQWRDEPLENLSQWSYADVMEYKNRSANWEEWDDEQWAPFNEWKEARDKEYEKLEWDAWAEYARRCGIEHGITKAVHFNEITNSTQVWADWHSSDMDPDLHPEYPWNQEPTPEELARKGGPMLDMSPEEIRQRIMGKRKKENDDDDEGY